MQMLQGFFQAALAFRFHERQRRPAVEGCCPDYLVHPVHGLTRSLESHFNLGKESRRTLMSWQETKTRALAGLADLSCESDQLERVSIRHLPALQALST
jgi:hypothetical protein